MNVKAACIQCSNILIIEQERAISTPVHTSSPLTFPPFRKMRKDERSVPFSLSLISPTFLMLLLPYLSLFYHPSLSFHQRFEAHSLSLTHTYAHTRFHSQCFLTYSFISSNHSTASSHISAESKHICVCMRVCVRVCMCVCERERRECRSRRGSV